MFQSTPPRGRRLRQPVYQTGQHKFQSTPPRGRRRSCQAVNCWIRSFNPRLREGGDSLSPSRPPAVACFNPRLREGGDVTEIIGLCRCQVFQSTPPRGRRRDQFEFDKLIVRFNPRLREGGDMYQKSAAHMQIGFNPRLREGGDMVFKCGLRRTGVSIHASAREATASLCGTCERFLFQSTPPRGRRPPSTLPFHLIQCVSIHASAREAT